MHDRELLTSLNDTITDKTQEAQQLSSRTQEMIENANNLTMAEVPVYRDDSFADLSESVVDEDQFSYYEESS